MCLWYHFMCTDLNTKTLCIRIATYITMYIIYVLYIHTYVYGCMYACTYGYPVHKYYYIMDDVRMYVLCITVLLYSMYVCIL